MTYPKINLNRSDVLKLLEFCRSNKIDHFFIAKDQGAYIGSATGPNNNCIFYFLDCDPTKDADWYDNSRSKFGGDDFGENIPLKQLELVESDPQITSMRLTVTPNQFKFEYFIGGKKIK